MKKRSTEIDAEKSLSKHRSKKRPSMEAEKYLYNHSSKNNSDYIEGFQAGCEFQKKLSESINKYYVTHAVGKHHMTHKFGVKAYHTDIPLSKLVKAIRKARKK